MLIRARLSPTRAGVILDYCGITAKEKGGEFNPRPLFNCRRLAVRVAHTPVLLPGADDGEVVRH